MKRLLQWAGAVALGIAAAGATTAARAQSFPSKPVRIVVPYPPGGVDVSIRIMQKAMSDELGQPVVVENRPGANTAIGSQFVARSAPDGYTLLGTSTALVTGAAIGSVPLDPVKDFVPLALVYTSMGVLAAHPSTPYSNLKELIEYARKNPGKVNYATIGVGSEQHLTGEMLKLGGAFDMNHIVYKGFGPMLQAMVADEVPLILITYQGVKPFLTSGRSKAIAVYSLKRRHPEIPAVADFTEIVPSFATTRSWVGLLAPAGLPRPLAARLSASAVKSINASGVRDKMEEMGFIVMAGGAEEFAEWIRTDFDTAVKLVRDVKAAGVKFE